MPLSETDGTFKNSVLDFVLDTTKEHKDEFIKAWQEYFKGK